VFKLRFWKPEVLLLDNMATRVPRMDKNRRAFMAVAFAAIVIVGSLTGAQLKEDKQKADVRFAHIHPTLFLLPTFQGPWQLHTLDAD
jgi:hypothetical protein